MLRGCKATVWGLGHFGGGLGAARWLAEQGASVTVTDAAEAEALADVLPRLADMPIAALHLGGHRQEDFSNADLIVVNPAIHPDNRWLDAARRSGARLRTELELFLENCPARVVGVTGSNGKSTTAAMIAAMLQKAGRTVFLGGNLGGSLLDQLPRMTAQAWVVLEISSFQLWHFSSTARMPHVAVVTGCTPNHLDWHASFADYAAAKQRMLTGQTAADFAVFNEWDAETARWATLVRGRQVHAARDLSRLPPLRTPGQHNCVNAALAAAAAEAAGCSPEAIREGLESFRGLPQRIEPIAVVQGATFYNDSTATTPESTIAALRAISAPIWLLAGGKNKGFDFHRMTAEIAARCAGAAFFGSVREELLALTQAAAKQANDAATSSAARNHGGDFSCVAVETLPEAFQWCCSHIKRGDAVLLSPGCASTDQFRNFRERGDCFLRLTEARLGCSSTS
jgi:UDP-N-acetylmuramoylalanine--D-glutamate ligase